MEHETGEYLVVNILSEDAETIRKYLLIDLFLSFAIVKGGLLPTSVQALGIELNLENVKSLIMLLLISSIYLFFDFLIKALSSVLAWRMRFYCAIASEFKSRGEISGEVEGRPNVPGHNHKIDFFMKVIKKNNLVRFGFEIFVPLILSIIIIVILIEQIV